MRNKSFNPAWAVIVVLLACCLFSACKTEEPLPGVVTYSVTVNVTGGGDCTADPQTAAAGTIITLTFEFDEEALVIKSVAITDADGNDVEYDTQNCTFTMPESDVTVDVAFMEKKDPRAITIVSVANGSIQSSHTQAQEGVEVTVTLIPATECTYVANSLKINKASSGTVTYTAKGATGLVFAFEMPDEDVSIEASFVKEGIIYIEDIELDFSSLETPTRDGVVPGAADDFAADGSFFTATIAIQESSDGTTWTGFSGSAYTVGKFVKFVITLKAEDGYVFDDGIDIPGFGELEAEDIDGLGTDTVTFSYSFPVKIGVSDAINFLINVEADFEGFPEEIIVESGSDVTIELEQYEDAKWYVSGELVGSDGSYTLKAADFPKPNIYSLTMVVIVNGLEYSKIIDFEVK